jgi:hypothetical protein
VHGLVGAGCALLATLRRCACGTLALHEPSVLAPTAIPFRVFLDWLAACARALDRPRKGLRRVGRKQRQGRHAHDPVCHAIRFLLVHVTRLVHRELGLHVMDRYPGEVMKRRHPQNDGLRWPFTDAGRRLAMNAVDGSAARRTLPLVLAQPPLCRFDEQGSG